MTVNSYQTPVNKQLTPCSINPIYRAIDSVLSYLWDDEAMDYHACPQSQRENHIFAAMKEIRRWLNTSKKMLDKSYHTVARACSQEMPFDLENMPPPGFRSFANRLFAFALQHRFVCNVVHTNDFGR